MDSSDGKRVFSSCTRIERDGLPTDAHVEHGKRCKGLAGFPAGTFGLKQLHDRKLLLNAQRSLVELLERDGNNPAVILWSLGNESYSLHDLAGRVYVWLRRAARSFDPMRPVSMAEMTYYLPVLDSRRASARYLDLASLNMYFGW